MERRAELKGVWPGEEVANNCDQLVLGAESGRLWGQRSWQCIVYCPCIDLDAYLQCKAWNKPTSFTQ